MRVVLMILEISVSIIIFFIQFYLLLCTRYFDIISKTLDRYHPVFRIPIIVYHVLLRSPNGINCKYLQSRPLAAHYASEKKVDAAMFCIVIFINYFSQNDKIISI